MSVAELPVTLRCTGCGDPYDVTSRTARNAKAGKTRQMCRNCRGEERRKPTAELTSAMSARARSPITEADRQFWLDRFTLDEIREIVFGMYPGESQRERNLELLAS